MRSRSSAADDAWTATRVHSPAESTYAFSQQLLELIAPGGRQLLAAEGLEPATAHFEGLGAVAARLQGLDKGVVRVGGVGEEL